MVFWTIATECSRGDGVMNLERFIEILHKKNYDGMVSIETFRPEYWQQDVEAVIKEAKEKTDRSIKMVCG